MNLGSTMILQAVPPAPGRGDDAPAPPPAPGQPAQGAPPSQGPGGALGGLFPVLLFLPVVLILFFSGRSQQKKQRDLESKLKTGDQVVTQSGLIGKLVEKGDRYARVEIAPGIKVKMLKTAVTGLDTGEEAAKPAPNAK